MSFTNKLIIFLNSFHAIQNFLKPGWNKELSLDNQRNLLTPRHK